MKLYTVIITYGYSNNSQKTLKVVAKSTQKALELSESYAKKNYFSCPHVTYLGEDHEVNIVQK